MLSKFWRRVRTYPVFPFLVFFRWASLLPAVLMIGDSSPWPRTVFAIPLGANLFVFLFNAQLNRAVLRRPWLFGLDLIFCALVLTLSGGSHSPYYLYALSPVLASAFFFQMRGALSAAAIFTVLYLLADQIAHRWMNLPTSASDIVLITQIAGIWLFPILVAFPSLLLRDLQQARDELAQARDELAQQHENLATAHRQLKVIHDLTVLLQAAPDLSSVQQRVLSAVTTGLGFRRAIVGIVDPARQTLEDWKLHPYNSSFPAEQPLSLDAQNGLLIQALLNHQEIETDETDQVLVSLPALNVWLRTCHWYVYPLWLREHAVGLLLVEKEKSNPLSPQRREILRMVANQAALALGTTILCIDRARRLAVETERNRIARDIHDTVAQSLFGMVYSLDACISMLPQQAEAVKDELSELRSLAHQVHNQVRHSIFDLWPSSLTLEVFERDLNQYINTCCRPRKFSIEFHHQGNFESLSSGLRRTLYRMAQETLANAARHAGVDSARLSLIITSDRVTLEVSDQGRGFDPELALARSQNREHFGLHGLRERAQALGGECEIVSRPNAGTRITIHLPLNSHRL